MEGYDKNPYTEAGVKLYRVIKDEDYTGYGIDGCPVALSHKDLISKDWSRIRESILSNIQDIYRDALDQMKDDNDPEV